MQLNYAKDRKDHYHTDQFYTVIRSDGKEFDIPGNLVRDHLKRGFELKHAPFVSVAQHEANKTAYAPEVTLEEVTIDVEEKTSPEPETELVEGLEQLTRPQLMTLAKEQGHKVQITMKKADLIEMLSK